MNNQKPLQTVANQPLECPTCIVRKNDFQIKGTCFSGIWFATTAAGPKTQNNRQVIQECEHSGCASEQIHGIHIVCHEISQLADCLTQRPSDLGPPEVTSLPVVEATSSHAAAVFSSTAPPKPSVDVDTMVAPVDTNQVLVWLHRRSLTLRVLSSAFQRCR